MPRPKFALALIALAVIIPLGLPNGRVYAVHVDTIGVGGSTLNGHVDWYQGQYAIYDFYVRTTPLIERGYTEIQDRARPRMNGFSTFEVPYHSDAGGIPSCTLHYYQAAHSGSADLRVNYLYDITYWSPSDNDLFWAAWNDTITIATDDAQSTDGWHTVALTLAGNTQVGTMAASGGGNLITGWTYRDSVSGTYADVTGSGQNAPFIVAVYQQ